MVLLQRNGTRASQYLATNELASPFPVSDSGRIASARRELGPGNLASNRARGNLDFGIVANAFVFARVAARHHVELAIFLREPDRRWTAAPFFRNVARLMYFCPSNSAGIAAGMALILSSEGAFGQRARFPLQHCPPAVGLCYKAYMRKWMRERIKRRKKPDRNAGHRAEPSTPLQPDYYDAQASDSRRRTGSAKHAEAVADRRATRSSGGSRRRKTLRKPLAAWGTRSCNDDVAVEAGVAADGASARPHESHAQNDGGRSLRRRPAAPMRPAGTAATASLRSRSGSARAASKGMVVLAIGLPGSGKSSWFKRHEITPSRATCCGPSF